MMLSLVWDFVLSVLRNLLLIVIEYENAMWESWIDFAAERIAFKHVIAPAYVKGKLREVVELLLQGYASAYQKDGDDSFHNH